METLLQISGIGSLDYQNRILTVRLIDGLEITAPILEKINATGVKLANGQNFCVLADLRLNISSTPEARKYGAKNDHMKNHLAYAMLADSMPVVILANFFIKVNRPKVPTRLFKKEEDALQWLKEFLS